MKWLGRAVFWLITLVIILIVATALVVQTSWGTKQVSALISDNTRYKVSLSAISHSLSSPHLFHSVMSASARFPVILPWKRPMLS